MANHLLRHCLCGYLGFYLVLALAPAESRACQVAHQNRLIPLGTLKGQLKVLEFVVRRERAPERLQKKKVWEWWEGKAWLRTVDQKGHLLLPKKFVSKVVLLGWGKTYEAGLRKVVKLARRKFNIPNNLKRIEVDFCTYKKRCRKVKMKMRGKKSLALLHRNGKRLMTLDRRYLALLSESFSFRIDGENRFVMLYTVHAKGNKRFAVMQVASYGLSKPWRTMSPMKRRVCRNPLRCLPPSLILHHGKTIDVIMAY